MSKLTIEDRKLIYARMIELSRELKIPMIESIIRATLISKQGNRKLLFDRHSETHVRNLWNFHTCLTVGESDDDTWGDGYLGIKRIEGTEVTCISLLMFPSRGIGGTGGSTSGVVIGRGSTAESFDSHDLATYIEHGTDLNQMEYSATVLTSGWNSGSKYWYGNRSRVMSNNSGGSITVTESGVRYYSSTTPRFQLVRDLDTWGAGQAVADSESIEVVYEIRSYYP